VDVRLSFSRHLSGHALGMFVGRVASESTAHICRVNDKNRPICFGNRSKLIVTALGRKRTFLSIEGRAVLLNCNSGYY
jgi:hypothetical protein